MGSQGAQFLAEFSDLQQEIGLLALIQRQNFTDAPGRTSTFAAKR
jgi:hypothetical protein